MSLALYGHPFSSYTQKVLIALYENGTPLEFRSLGPDMPRSWASRYPSCRGHCASARAPAW